MFEIAVRYKVNYLEDKFEILYPVLENMETIGLSTTHDFYELKKNDAYFLVVYKNINEKIMNALHDNKRVFISKDINYHYLQENDIEILDCKNVNTNYISKYVVYITNTRDNKIFISYISDKVNTFCQNNYYEIDKKTYNTLLSIRKKYPYGYFQIVDYRNNNKEILELTDIVIIHYYCNQNSIDIREDVISNNIELNLSSFTYLSKNVFYAVNQFVNNHYLSLKNIHGPKYLDLLTFISKHFYEIKTFENPFDEDILFKTIDNIYDIKIINKYTVLGVFKEDPAVLKIQEYKLINNEEYKLYITNHHKTQFLSYQYFGFSSIYNMCWIDNNIKSNAIVYENNKIYTQITSKNINKASFFKTESDMQLFNCIDSHFLDIQILKNKVNIGIKYIDDNYENVFFLVPYENESMYILQKVKETDDIKNSNYEYVYIYDAHILEYLNHINEKKLIPLIPKDKDIVRLLNINSILVVTPEMCELEKKKTFFIKKIKSYMSQKYQNMDETRFLFFVKLLEEFSLYGIFICLNDESFDSVCYNEQINALQLPYYKKEKLLNQLNIIKNDIKKYKTLFNDYVEFYFDTYMQLENVMDMDDLNNIQNDIIKKYNIDVIEK